MRNLADVLDATLRLYAPVLGELMTEFPVKGIDLFIGRDEPSALAKDKEDRGYTHDTLAKAAAPRLKALVQATYDIQASCPLLIGASEPIRVYSRREDGRTVIEASVSNRLGGFFAKRRCVKLDPKGGEGYVLDPAVLFTTSMPDLTAEHVTALDAAAQLGFAEAARWLVEQDLVLNGKWDRGHTLLDWIAQFPLADGPAHLSSRFGGIYTVAARTSQHTQITMWVPPDLFARMRDDGTLAMMAKDGVLTVEALDGPVPGAPDMSQPDAAPAAR